LPPNIGHGNISLITSYQCNTNDLQPSTTYTLLSLEVDPSSITWPTPIPISCTWIWHHTLQYMECLEQGNLLHESYSICGFCTLYFVVYYYITV